MKSIFISIIFFCIGFVLLGEIHYALAVGFSGYLLAQLILESTRVFAFREWALFLYSVNYLLSPAITYQFDQEFISYPMKIPATDYFTLAIPGFMSFYAGMFTTKTIIFTPQIVKVKRDVKKNQFLLKNFVIIGILLRIFSSIFPGELAFLVYLTSAIRYVGAFALFSYDSKKYWIWVVAVLILELYYAAIAAMYHDAVMWLLFFALFVVYIKKPNISVRLIGLSVCLVFVLFIQGLKSVYRSKLSDKNNSDLTLVLETSSEVSNDITSEDNIFGSLSRGNQAWIFASVVERMNRIGDYQGLNILAIYTEAAILPRFLAPDKIKSGDKKIFNNFSGHFINENTSMGLGVFADGYIAFGYWGVICFTYGLGLLMNISFRIVESWAKSSEFYVLLVLPLLNYAIRPDCELQTTINHLVKGLVVFSVLVKLTKFQFVINGGASNNSKFNRAMLPKFNGIQN